ncbi:hypothetical protein [Microlunatus antarcticus]|uniref:Uncharacterized protein n=1 Tax=Microlunatus antarcticus TaxID=53388 RepID=A0A7W5P8M2_9ACTN|nr:hypothetical protein [Microlunatus antarcticus]MBB3328041.1 hypothetical protein [Microlunatus antarcticus]
MATTTTPPRVTPAHEPAPSSRRSPAGFVGQAYRWHRPLMLLTAASAVLFVGCLVGIVADPRELTGLPIWDKPAKFAVSIAIYAATLAWLLSVMPRHRRLASVLGTICAFMLAGEMVAIVTQVVRGRTSHFDFATPFDTLVYQSMAAMIGTLWVSNLVLVVLLLTQRLPDLTLTWALRLGMIIAVVGMALAFLMTLPTPVQQASWESGTEATVIGAHTVGLPDGGPGLPVLGWSTVGGDLRIPHFVGIHGLQVMIVLGLALSVLGTRFALLAASATRTKIVFVTAAAYVGVLAVLTWQALRGQSIVHPDAATALVTAALVAVTLGAYAVVLRTRPRLSGSVERETVKAR